MEIREIEIDDIKTGDWLRKDPGDIDGLAESLNAHGEVRPIVVTPDLCLVAGGRQLERHKRKGCKTVTVMVLEVADPLRAQLADNAFHKRYTPGEQVAIARLLFPEEVQAASLRQRGGKKVGGNSPKGRAWDRIARVVGADRKTLQKAFAVVEAAEGDPALQHLVEEMNRPPWKVDGAYQTVRQIQRGMPVYVNERGHKVRSVLKHDEPTTLWNTREAIKAFRGYLTAQVLPGGLSAEGQQTVLGQFGDMFCEVFWAWAKKEGMTAEQLKAKLCAAINAYPYEE